MASKPSRLYLDQMLKVDVARALRNAGFDVLRASEIGQDRADDQAILQKAISEDRILITLDEHFGNWVVLPISKHPGVIRLKVNPASSKIAIDLLLPFLRHHSPDNLKVIL
ncbi:MAG: DUF5615 family PIN-like protein [Candidatus Anammoxibacter sp.]